MTIIEETFVLLRVVLKWLYDGECPNGNAKKVEAPSFNVIAMTIDWRIISWSYSTGS